MSSSVTRSNIRLLSLALEANKIRKDRRVILAWLWEMHLRGVDVKVGYGTMTVGKPLYAAQCWLASKGYVTLGKTITFTSKGRLIAKECYKSENIVDCNFFAGAEEFS